MVEFHVSPVEVHVKHLVDEWIRGMQVLLPRSCISTEEPPVLVFDTETTGLVHPCVCQLAFVVFREGVLVRCHKSLLRLPKGVQMSPDAERVHGLSLAHVQEHGNDAVSELENLDDAMRDVLSAGGTVAGHNVAFDIRAIATTRREWSLDDGVKIPPAQLLCTPRASRQRPHKRDIRGRRKVLKNAELYEALHGTPPIGRLHDAMEDVRITLHSYLEGRAREWW